MAKYFKVEDAIEAAINGCASWDGGYYASMDDPIKDEFASIEDKCIEIVRCSECKHRFVDGDNVRFNVCELTHNRVQSDDWFCADGERKDGESDGET